jgi:hypothetical protein
MTTGTQDARTQRTARWRSAVAAGVLALATPAGAGLVPGGGSARSDCYAELDVAGVENDTPAVKRNRIVRCVDGDPCDAGPCGDGVCDFQVRLCWNQHDPNVPACVPPPVLKSLDLRGPLAALVLMPRDLGGTTCSESYTDFGVPTNPDGKRPGHLNVRIVAKAPAGTTPLVDTDVIRLVCVPRPYEECGGATTTTLAGATTTVPTTTTLRATTSTRTTTSSTSTTRRRPRQTTTTTRPTTSTAPPPPTTTSTTPPLPTTSTTVTPTTSLPETTGAPTTTTPTFAPTTTTRRRKGGDGGDILGIPLPAPL